MLPNSAAGPNPFIKAYYDSTRFQLTIVSSEMTGTIPFVFSGTAGDRETAERLAKNLFGLEILE